jgi:anti-sigma factor RsiW
MKNNMTCRELVELITDYLEGTLPAEARLRMENHLSGCDGCMNYLEQMRQTIRLTGQVRGGTLTLQQRAALLTLFRDWRKN